MTCVPPLLPLHPCLFFTPSCPMSTHSRPPTSALSHPPHLISPLHLVTMQIYLSPHARKTGSSENATSASAVPANSRLTAAPNNPQAKVGSKPETKRKPPTFTLNLQKTTTSQNTQDTSNYKSPIKSPSQYFQICYWVHWTQTNH